MSAVFFPNDTYATAPDSAAFWASRFPTPAFYWKVLNIVRREGNRAVLPDYTAQDWAQSSLDVLRALEDCGVTVEARGMDNMNTLSGPCVFIANHMSTLETFVLPCLIQPRMDVTFVTKDSLLKYPWFKHVLRRRDPIVVGRLKPREDLVAVLSGGEERLKRGISVIVFPQSTRSLTLDPAVFNSIGIKLAKRAGVPVVPIALRTDAWGIGSIIKDLGRIHPEAPVRFDFGEPFTVDGNGKEEHARVCSFIAERLTAWGLPALPPKAQPAALEQPGGM